MPATARSSRALVPGIRIGDKLEVVRHLSEGGMGSIWVAQNLATGADVAIKVLHRKSRDDAGLDAVERFRNEARIGAMLQHRHITKVFDLVFDPEDGGLVLVMELLRGDTLEQRARAQGPLGGRDAVAIVAPILLGLQHAHEQGIVHRDLKPTNIFLHVDPDGHVTPKLLDFGVAKMRSSSVKTVTGKVLGTPSYMSPEQVRARDLDGRSDVFVAATVLYEVMTGENPFAADDPSATLARVLEVHVDPDPRIEPALWLEIARGLSKEPYERHESAAAFARALRVAVGL